MAKKFKDLVARMPLESQKRVREEVAKAVSEMPLQSIRLARDLTQKDLAAILEIDQSEVSKIERRTDMYVSTLSRFIEAMGGELEIRAVFPEQTVRIKTFAETQR
jgi:DNA-binding Xre family transcriptional regulator